MWMRNLRREKCHLRTQVSPLRWPFHSLITSSNAGLLGMWQIPRDYYFQATWAQKIVSVPSGFILLGAGYAHELPWDQGLAVGRLRPCCWEVDVSFKWCCRYHFDPVVLLVGKLFQYFASPVVRDIFSNFYPTIICGQFLSHLFSSQWEENKCSVQWMRSALSLWKKVAEQVTLLVLQH